jgi:hypothetical protein
VKGKPIQNLAASVYARLLKRTELGDEDFQFVLMRYVAERLMYRLSQSEQAVSFVLKGAMLFLVWTGSQYRATKDMDLLALKPASVERLRDIFRELCQLAIYSANQRQPSRRHQPRCPVRLRQMSGLRSAKWQLSWR